MADALTTDRTVVANDDILASDYNNARADLHSVAEGFYDAGSPDLPLAMQVVGVHWTDPTSKAHRIFRQTAVGADARAKSSPLRPTWHYNDQSGAPADDARVAEGDLLVYDDGSNDRLLLACQNVSGVRSFYGPSVRADYRTAASSGSQLQDSGAVRMRGSSWDVSSSVARWRDAILQLDIETAVDDGDGTSLAVSFDGESGTARTPLRISDNGYFTVLATDADTFPILAFGTASGTRPSRALTVACIGPTPDECEILFSHSNSARMARWVFSAEPIRSGVDAEVLSVQTETLASGGSPTIDSSSFVWRGRYYDGAASQDALAYAQLTVESDDPSFSLNFGFGGVDGRLQLLSTGGANLFGDENEALALIQHTLADGTDKDRDSLWLVLTGTSWDGAVAQTRGVAFGTVITSPADASDTWEARWLDAGSFDMLATLSSAGHFGIGASPSTRLHSTETQTITGAVSDGFSGALTLEPIYTAATAQTVTRHNYIDLKNLVASGAGPASVTDAAVFRLDAALGTHKATTNADKTGNAKVGTLIVNVNGTLVHLQCYAA